jgi:hypothetical protein
MSIDRDAIKARLEATRDATSRSRFALLASTVAALSFLIAEFNAYISWNRDFALAEKFARPDSPTGIAQRRLLDDWVSSSSMNISLLGIHVNTSDATILGGVALFFLTLWLFYSIRRENRLVGTLLRNTRDSELAFMDLAFSGIISYMVFTAVRPNKPAINTLSDKPKVKKELEGDSFLGAQLLFILPPIAIFASLVFDFISLYLLAAPFREDHHLPLPQGSDFIKILVYTSVGILCLAATIVNSYRVRKFDRATGKVLREYNELLHDKLALAGRLRGLHTPQKSVTLDDDLHGISSVIALSSEKPAHIELRFDKACTLSNQTWERLVRHQVEIRKNYIGTPDFKPSITTDPHIISIDAAAKESEDKEIEYAVRELFRMRRLVYSHIATDRLPV